MEKTIINKMSFYDIVTLVVPSALVCYDYSWKPVGCVDSWEGYIAQFGVLLMVGLFLKGISALWGRLWFRNNTDIIKEERLRAKNLGGEHKVCRFLSILFFDPFMYILSPLSYLRYTEDPQEKDSYYAQYDKAYEKMYYGKRIDALESHVAFLQTWITALVIFVFEKPDYAGCILLACYISIVLMLSIQRKIYNLIWEA